MNAPEQHIRLAEDRLAFAVCFALALHAALILGLGFGNEAPAQKASRLDVVLVTQPDQNRQTEADFLAQLDQAGSGTERDKRELTESAIVEALPIENSEHSELQIERLSYRSDDRPWLTTAADSHWQMAAQPLSDDPTQNNELEGLDKHQRLNQQIAQLEARLFESKQRLAKAPRIKRLTSLSTRSAIDAQYLHQWRQRVENVGNKHYPIQARRRGIEGELRMLVALESDGSIREVKILQSSGYSLLDRAALRVVYLAAPYPPFGTELAAETDVLEIIRTWRFENQQMSARN